ncbi:MAG TPA: BPSL0067 family protein [Acetobacteraceae bacterium]|nr:BPSL0067 family protein [Acetobacteraceae bacterium]
MADDLKIPFLFIPHGEPESPEAAEFKARYPSWFSIPATFVPRIERSQDVPPPERLDAPDTPPAPARGARRLDGQTSMAASVRAFQRASEVHGDPVTALRALKENPDAFADPAPASTHGYVATDPERWIGHSSVGSGQCVALVQRATGAPLTAQWRRGALVKGNMALRPGTAIATFDPNGRYGNHTDGRSHAAIYLGQDAHGIRVIDQWIQYKGGKAVWIQAPHARTIKFDDSRIDIENANRYYVVN